MHRESLEEFFTAYRAAQEQRTARRAAREAAAKLRRAAAPRGRGWISTAEAAELLGVTRGHVLQLASTAGLTLARRGRLVLLRREEVAALARERGEWISHKEAREVTRLSDRAVVAAVEAGHIRTRASARHGEPTLLRSSVEAWGAAERERRERARAEREVAQLERRARNGPPRDGNAWMSVYSASVLLAVTPGRVAQLIAAERLPATRCGVRWWLQATHVRQAVAAREARVRRRASLPRTPQEVPASGVGSPLASA